MKCDVHINKVTTMEPMHSKQNLEDKNLEREKD